jgi:hypothetical protein
MFLTATNNGELKLENITGGYVKGKPILSTNVPKNGRFQLIDAVNPYSQQKPVKFNDSIILRSNTFHTLLLLNYDALVSCSGQVSTPDAIWKVINPKIPYISDFVFKRKNLHFNNLSYTNFQENIQNKDLLNSSFSSNKKKSKNNFQQH